MTTSNKPHIHLRPARPTDIPALTTLFTTTYSESTLHLTFFPTYKSHIPHHQRTWSSRLYNTILSPTHCVVVAVTPETRSPDNTIATPERIIGCSIWERLGPIDSGSAAETILGSEGWGGIGDGGNHSMALRVLERRLYTTYTAYRDRLFPNPSRDVEKLAAFRRAYAKVDEEVFERHFGTRWHMDEVVVDPAWRGKGVGRRLVEIGMGWVEREEGMALCLATEEGEGVYRKLGWELGGELEVGGRWFAWRSGGYRGWWFREERDVEGVDQRG